LTTATHPTSTTKARKRRRCQSRTPTMRLLSSRINGRQVEEEKVVRAIAKPMTMMTTERWVVLVLPLLLTPTTTTTLLLLLIVH
jgi:hypothetical protein